VVGDAVVVVQTMVPMGEAEGDGRMGSSKRMVDIVGWLCV